jgi:hypothetical protein
VADLLRFSYFELTDSGDPEGLRFVIEALEQDADDTSRVATVHVASCYSLDMATTILLALRQAQAARQEAVRK